MAVSAELVQHYWWLWSMLTDHDVARRLLAVVPAEVRADAARVAGSMWDRAFGDLLAQLISDGR